MLRQFFINSLFRINGLLVIFFLLIPVCALSEKTLTKKKGPIVVTSKMLTINNKNHTAIFENSVVAQTTDMILYADKMFVFYNKDTGNITRIDALGKVKVVEKDRVITSNEATYYAHDERVIFRGNLKVLEGKNVVADRKKIHLPDRKNFFNNDSNILIKKK